MERAVALRLLPSILTLPPEMLKPALVRMCTPTDGGSTNALFSPVELLASLHTIDTGGVVDAVRRSMTAISVCINIPELFPGEVLAATINQLLTRVPLPQLFMRTVIQSLGAAPRLRTFVVGVLVHLAAKQIWNDGIQWRGWVMAAQQTAPESFPALLQLPAAILSQVLPAISAEVRAQLLQYAGSPECTVSVPKTSRDVLITVSRKAHRDAAAASK